MQVPTTTMNTTMNTALAAGAPLPQIATGFVRKLYRILDQESGPVISWTRGGTAFAIFDAAALNELILPRYFRGRLCAFRQQLREHGFRELLSAGGSVPIAPVAPHPPQPATYFHEHFIRGAPGRLAQIPRTPLPRRRMSSRKGKAAAGASSSSAVAKRAAVAVAAATATVARVKAKEASSYKRARVGSVSSASPVSTSTPSATSSTTASPSSSSSTPSSSSMSSTSITTTSSAIDAQGSSPSLALAPVQPHVPQPIQQSTAKRKNPLFSDESDSTWGGDWLSLDDISPPGATLSTAGVSTDITFSEDMLGALVTLVNNSMSTTASPTSTCGSAVSCGAKLASASGAALPLCGVAKRAGVIGSAGGPTVYETHQFSDDTINSMMMWLGSGGST